MDNKIFSKNEYLDFLEKSSFDAFIKKFNSKSAGAGTFEVVISTSHPDRDGDIINQRGISYVNYWKQPVVLSHHDWYKDPVGICDEVEVRTTKDGIEYTIARGRFADTEKGQTQRKLYELGLSGISIGFGNSKRDEENPAIIKSCELLEFSFVNIMAQQNASRYLLDEKSLEYAVKYLNFNMNIKTSETIEQKETVEETVEEEVITEETPTEENEVTEEVVEETTAEEVEESKEETTEGDSTETEESETVESEESEVEKALKNLQETTKVILDRLKALEGKSEENDNEPESQEAKFLEFKRNLQKVAGELSKSLGEAKKTKV